MKIRYEFVNGEVSEIEVDEGLIIADEGHKIKTHNIAASKAMHRLGRAASYRLLLTGTVITNKAIDVFSQYIIGNIKWMILKNLMLHLINMVLIKWSM